MSQQIVQAEIRAMGRQAGRNPDLLAVARRIRDEKVTWADRIKALGELSKFGEQAVSIFYGLAKYIQHLLGVAKVDDEFWFKLGAHWAHACKAASRVQMETSLKQARQLNKTVADGFVFGQMQ